MSAITTEELRVKADELGIKYTAKTSDDTLLAKIEKAEKEKENNIYLETPFVTAFE